jgi:hypothetical protein
MALVYASGNFIAAGSKGKVAYSADGDDNWNWSQNLTGTDPGRKGALNIAHNGSGVFAAVIEANAYLSYSANPFTNGSSWTWPEHHIGTGIEAIAFGNGKFIAAGSGGKVSVSGDNAASWSPMTVGDDAADKTQFRADEIIRAAVFAGDKWILAAEGKFAVIQVTP